MAQLEDFVDHTVTVILNDGRNIVGLLRGADQVTNLIIEDCHERVFTLEGVKTIPLGLYVARGDNVAVGGEVDPELEKQIEWATKIKTEPLPPIKH